MPDKELRSVYLVYPVSSIYSSSSGTGIYLKDKNPKVQVICADPQVRLCFLFIFRLTNLPIFCRNILMVALLTLYIFLSLNVPL